LSIFLIYTGTKVIIRLQLFVHFFWAASMSHSKILVSCPFNKTHKVAPENMAKHVAECVKTFNPSVSIIDHLSHYTEIWMTCTHSYTLPFRPSISPSRRPIVDSHWVGLSSLISWRRQRKSTMLGGCILFCTSLWLAVIHQFIDFLFLFLKFFIFFSFHFLLSDRFSWRLNIAKTLRCPSLYFNDTFFSFNSFGWSRFEVVVPGTKEVEVIQVTEREKEYLRQQAKLHPHPKWVLNQPIFLAFISSTFL
jgi:hypothetical protein